MAAIGSVPARGWLAFGAAITFFALAMTAPDDAASVDESLLLPAGLGSAALLWFVGALVAEARRREADSTFATVALGSATVVAVFASLGAALRVIPSLAASESGDLPNAGSADFVELANNELIHIATFWRGSLMGAAALMMVPMGGLARWYGWFSAALAAGSFLGGLSFVESPVAAAGTVAGFASYIAFHFWVALGGVVLLALSRSMPGNRQASIGSPSAALSNTISLVALGLLVACSPVTQTAGSALPGSSDSIAGTYACGSAGTAKDIVELRADGTLTITHPDGTIEGPGTWSVDGGSGAFAPGTPEEDPFTIEGEDLVFGDPGASVRFVCALTNAETPTSLGPATPRPSPTERPSTAPPLTLVAVGDSIANAPICQCRPYPAAYGILASEALGRIVVVQNEAIPGSTSSDVLAQVLRPPLSSALERADIITVTIGINDIRACLASQDTACFESAVTGVTTNLNAILDEILRLKAGERYALRVTAYFNQRIGDPASAAKGAAFQALWADKLGALNAAICSAAMSHDGICVELLTVFNGPNGDQDAAALLGPDHDHPTGAGNQLIAEAIAASGYAPLQP